jgi:hypothetical protein
MRPWTARCGAAAAAGEGGGGPAKFDWWDRADLRNRAE